MSKFYDFLRLIRYQNLLFIIIIQYLMRFFIMAPMLWNYGFKLQFSEFNFLLLVVATVLIAAAGYIINDYNDVNIDLINKPNRVIIDKSIKKETAMFLYMIFTFVGIAISLYLSVYIKLSSLVILFVIISGLLWFYSTSYKSEFLIGNLVVSFLAAMVPVVVYLAELPVLNSEYNRIIVFFDTGFNKMLSGVLIYGIFAFILTFIREIIKDIEDFEGDSALGSKSFPIMIGVQYSKVIIIGLISLTILGVSFVYMYFLMIKKNNQLDYISLFYLLIFVVIPLIYLIKIIYSAKEKSDYTRSSLLSKGIMLTAVLYSVILSFVYKI